MKVVFCHLDSLSCLPALNLVFDELGEHIGLVVSSTRFGSKHGSLWEQTFSGIRRLGFGLNLWFGFDLMAPPIVARLARPLSRLIGRPPALATLPELAARYDAKLLKAININSDEMLDVIAAYAPDLIIVMNFDQILQPRLIRLALLGVLNVHPSLLPSLRGPCPVIWALAQRRPVSGATIHLIEDASVDAGPILAQRQMPIAPGQSVAQVNATLFLAGASLLRNVVSSVAANRRASTPQSNGEYLGFPTRADMEEFRKSGHRLCRVADILRLLLPALGLSKSSYRL